MGNNKRRKIIFDFQKEEQESDFDKMLKSTFITCSIKLSKGKFNIRRMNAYVCSKKSIGECVLREMYIPDNQGLTHAQFCVGCTKWVGEVRNVQEEPKIRKRIAFEIGGVG